MLQHHENPLSASPVLDGNRRLVTTVEAYSEAFMNQEPVDVAHLCGRLIRGTKPEDFETLTDDPDRRLVMLMGPDGLAQLPGKSGYDMLTRVIGYTPEYTAFKFRQGMSFKLAVFAESDIARPATWDNVMNLVGQTYAGIEAPLQRHSDDLKTTPFARIEAAAGYSFEEVNQNGEQDERYMTYERFLQSPQDLLATRAFFYFAVHLRGPFSGDGYTYDYEGQRGVLEYMIPNRPITELGTHALLDVPVELPESKQ